MSDGYESPIDSVQPMQAIKPASPIQQRSWAPSVSDGYESSADSVHATQAVEFAIPVSGPPSQNTEHLACLHLLYRLPLKDQSDEDAYLNDPEDSRWIEDKSDRWSQNQHDDNHEDSDEELWTCDTYTVQCSDSECDEVVDEYYIPYNSESESENSD